MGQQRARGRPPASDATAPGDTELLDGALAAFAELGFAGMSVRELARQLGVSHNLIPQRFGSKERLWYAAVDHGFALLHLDLLSVLADPPPDDLGRLRALVVRFVEANATRPALLRIINQESVSGGPRLDYLFTKYIGPVREFGDMVLAQLHAQGEVRLQSAGIMYFLMTNGAGGPLVFPGLAERLGAAVDPSDPTAVRAYAEHVVDVLFEGIGHV